MEAFSVLTKSVMLLKVIHLIIPRTSINIDTSVNAAFIADKMNAAKIYLDITDC